MSTLPTALIIEDDLYQSEIFSQALTEAGYEICSCTTGQQALDKLAQTQERPYLVVLDMHLPDINGKQILHYIRSSTTLKDTKVILATANPQMAATLHEISDLVLIKPISFSQLKQLALRLHPENSSR